MRLGGCSGRRKGRNGSSGVCVCEGKDVADDVINWVEKCGARGK